jgi:hypothetical protein
MHDCTIASSGEFAGVGVVTPGECGHVPIFTTHIHNQGLGLASGKSPHR